MALLRLPDAKFPVTPGATGDGNTPQEPSVQQQILAGIGTVIPIIYGEAKVGGLLANALTYQSSLVLTIVWCVGEITELEVYINDAAPPAGVEILSYLGSPYQEPDSYLVSILPGYSDNLVYVDPQYGRLGIAYSVIIVPAGTAGINGMPRITARIMGRKIYSVLESVRMSSTNPADILADFISDPIVGMRRNVNRQSHYALADCNAEIMLLGGKRRELSLVLDSAQDVTQWVETIRTYAGCQIYFDGDEAFFSPYRPTLSNVETNSIGPEDIIKDSLQITRNPAHPNVVRVTYTDTDTGTDPWVTYNAFAATDEVIAGTASWREESLSMTGIHNFGQAYREAAERLAYHQYGDPHITFTMVDKGLRYTVGDVVYLTHPIGFTDEPFLIETIDCNTPGRWEISACHYHEDLFNSEDPEPPDNLVVEPGEPTYGPVADLTLVEVIAKVNKFPVSKIQASWTGLNSINLEKYEIQWQGKDSSAWNTDFSPTENWVSPQVIVGLVYTVRVRAMYTDGSVGQWVTETLAIVGKTTTGWEAPRPPSGATGAFYVELVWDLPYGDDVAYTEVYMSVLDDIATASLIAKVAAPYNRYLLPGLPAGVCRYFWTRFADTSDNFSDLSPNSPSGIQLCTPTSDDNMLTYLTGQIRESHLYETLAEQITYSSDTAIRTAIEVGQLTQDVYAEYYVKIDANGRVAGFGLANQVDGYSQFLVRADRFSVIGTDDSSEAVAPFVVEGGTVYLDKASIRDADIEAAKIADLTLTTAKIAENQVTTINGFYNGDTRTYHEKGQDTKHTFPVTYEVGSFELTGANVYCIALFSQFVLEATVDCPTNVTIELTGGYNEEYSIVFVDRGVQHLTWFPTIDPLPDRKPITVTLYISVTPAIYTELTLTHDPFNNDILEYVSHLSDAYTSEHGMAGVTYAR